MYMTKDQWLLYKMKLKGLNPNSEYVDAKTGKVYGGDVLMNIVRCVQGLCKHIMVFKKKQVVDIL